MAGQCGSGARSSPALGTGARAPAASSGPDMGPSRPGPPSGLRAWPLPATAPAALPDTLRAETFPPANTSSVTAVTIPAAAAPVPGRGAEQCLRTRLCHP